MWPIAWELKSKRQAIASRRSSSRMRRHRRYRFEQSFLEGRLLLSTLYAVGSGIGDGKSHLYEIENYATGPTAVDIGSTGVVLDALAIDPATWHSTPMATFT